MKQLKLSALVLIALFFASCATIPQSTTASGSGLVIRGTEDDPHKLAKNQFLSITHRVDHPIYLQASNWSKVRILSDLLDALLAHTEFSNAEKYSLLTFIFDDLPLNGKEGVVREVHIGKYYSNGDPLVLRVGVFTPQNEAAAKNEKVIVLMSNVIKLKDKSLNRTMGAFVNLDANAALYCGLNKGLLTNGQKGEDPKRKVDLQTLSGIERVMLAQDYLADENVSNDGIANDLVSKNIESATEQPAIVIMSMLVKYDYLLSIEDVQGAEALWKRILEYSKNVPGDMNPESLESMNGESLYLMKRLLSK